MRGLLQDYSGKLADRRNPNLAPLIDVVFQLILFFLVTSTFTWYSGMKVKLPEASSSSLPSADRDYRVHIVRSGESLSVIAGRYKVELAQLRQVNKIPSADMIYVGQRLWIP